MSTKKKWNIKELGNTGLFAAIKDISQIKTVIKTEERGDNSFYDAETYDELADIIRNAAEYLSEVANLVSNIED